MGGNAKYVGVCSLLLILAIATFVEKIADYGFI